MWRGTVAGARGDGAKSNDEVAAPFFLVCSSACWNGICLAAMDITKNHTTRKVHNDVGMRVADNPTIQDYVGECLIDLADHLRQFRHARFKRFQLLAQGSQRHALFRRRADQGSALVAQHFLEAAAHIPMLVVAHRIVGECGGAAMCATCHVYLDPEFAEKVPPVGELEADMLECAAAPTTQFSRLSCQIVLKPELEDLVVHLPASQY